MNICNYLLVEGTTQYAILCYGFFQKDILNNKFKIISSENNLKNSFFYKFEDENWPSSILLHELHIMDNQDISVIIEFALKKMIADGALGAVCMFDGAFYDYSDICSPAVMKQTYAYSFAGGKSVLAMDTQILESKEWLISLNSLYEKSKILTFAI